MGTSAYFPIKHLNDLVHNETERYNRCNQWWVQGLNSKWHAKQKEACAITQWYWWGREVPFSEVKHCGNGFVNPHYCLFARVERRAHFLSIFQSHSFSIHTSFKAPWNHHLLMSYKGEIAYNSQRDAINVNVESGCL